MSLVGLVAGPDSLEECFSLDVFFLSFNFLMPGRNKKVTHT